MQAAQRQLLSDSQDRVRIDEIRSKPQIEIPSQVSKSHGIVVPRGGLNDERFRDKSAGKRSSGKFKEASSRQFICIRLYLTVSNAMQPGLCSVLHEPLATDARQHRGESAGDCQKSIYRDQQTDGVQCVVMACGVASL